MMLASSVPMDLLESDGRSRHRTLEQSHWASPRLRAVLVAKMRWIMLAILGIYGLFAAALLSSDGVPLFLTRPQLLFLVLAAAASAAGLDFTPPAGVNAIQVVRPGGMRATLPPASGGRSVVDAAVRRGETVTLVYAAPGLALSMRARALEDGAVGDSIRFLNTSSNRQIDGVVTAPGQAQASP